MMLEFFDLDWENEFEGYGECDVMYISVDMNQIHDMKDGKFHHMRQSYTLHKKFLDCVDSFDRFFVVCLRVKSSAHESESITIGQDILRKTCIPAYAMLCSIPSYCE